MIRFGLIFWDPKRKGGVWAWSDNSMFDYTCV